MSRNTSMCILAVLATCVSTVLASAQVLSSQTDAKNVQTTTSSPVAYVYVSNNPSRLMFNIYAYAAASNGSLSNVSGSPFATDVFYLAVNGRWLFGTNGVQIHSYSIASNGSLKSAATYTAGTNGGGPVNLFLDHTGADLYAGFANLHGTGNNGYQSYSINQTTGKITFLNEVGSSTELGSVLSFVSGNVHAYTSSCYHFTPLISGFKRNSNGTLSELNLNQVYPTAVSGEFYCPFLAAADPFGHFVMAVQPYSGFGSAAGPYQLATYSVDSFGNLRTMSTHSNMPSVLVGAVNDYWMSPDGHLLAVGGSSGLQVFHFNGANPITHYTGLLTSNSIDQVFWDNASHLYAISRKAGKLYVFTVTSSSVTQAPGSPHSFTNPVYLIVLPKT